jgi:hypothetical protein
MELKENQAQNIGAFIPKGRFFFTATLLERHRKLLDGLIGNLRVSFTQM